MKTLATAGVAALLLATTGYAALAGTIAGTIKGPDGAPFRAAFVRVQNLSNKITMMVLTDSQGRYFADNLPTGNYAVTPNSVGFKASPLRRNNVAVQDGGKVALISPCRTAWSSGASSPSTRPAHRRRRRTATARRCSSSSASTATPSARSAPSAATTCRVGRTRST